MSETTKKKKEPVLKSSLDVLSSDEQRKREERLKRWDPDAAERREQERKDKEKRVSRAARFGQALSVEWLEFSDRLAIDVTDLFAADEGRAETTSSFFFSAEEEQAKKKLHLRVIPKDRESFKRLRSDDLVAHFETFGATYVEWLGDRSCNVWFHDDAGAARALQELSWKIPTDVPVDVDDANLGASWRLLKAPVVKCKVDPWGAFKGDHPTFLLCRFATADDVLKDKPTHHKRPAKNKGQKKKRARDTTTAPSSSSHQQRKFVPVDTKSQKKKQDEPTDDAGDDDLRPVVVEEEGNDKPANDDQDDDGKDDDDPRAAKRRKFAKEQETVQDDAAPNLKEEADDEDLFLDD